MAEVTLMLRSKETDNKQRWAADVNGVEFKLYIPKHRIPDPFPPSIVVRISPVTGAEPSSVPDPDQPIRCVVARVCEHTQTVRYCPLGDAKGWQIGEPYIPFGMLPESPPLYLLVEVHWLR
jgi:hypothetical protein